MGLLKLFLAMLICIMHAKHQGVLPQTLLPDVQGLELDPKLNLFFAMAGFFSYAALVGLRRRDVAAWVWVFYRSRCLRVWPAYWVCAIITYILIRCCSYEITSDRLMPGQETWKFLLYNMIPFVPDSLIYQRLPDAWHHVILVFVVLQAWSMALLMPLFAVAPLLLVPGVMWVMVPISLLGLYQAYGISGQYHGYVMIALPYFLLGAWVYRGYERYFRSHSFSSVMTGAVWLGAFWLALVCANYQALVRWVGLFAANYAVVALGAMLMGPLYALTRGVRWDQWASQLSYTLYLSHFIVFYMLKQLPFERGSIYWATIPSCLLVAGMLHWGVERPLWRIMRRRSNFL